MGVTISALRAGEEGTFDIDFAYFYEKIADINKAPMRILRLSFEYRREIDGRDFSARKLYLIAGNGDLLVDFDAQDTVIDFLGVERLKRRLE